MVVPRGRDPSPLDTRLHAASNERYARGAGITEVVLPKPGRKSTKRIADEQQDWFQAGRNWRAGIAGRISGLKRQDGRARCRSHGDGGLERWVGLGRMVPDLRVLAQHLGASRHIGRGGRQAAPC